MMATFPAQKYFTVCVELQSCSLETTIRAVVQLRCCSPETSIRIKRAYRKINMRLYCVVVVLVCWTSAQPVLMNSRRMNSFMMFRQVNNMGSASDHRVSSCAISVSNRCWLLFRLLFLEFLPKNSRHINSLYEL